MQLAHDDADAAVWYVPAAHNEHVDELTAEYCPATQLTHAVEATAPAVADAVPAAHDEHAGDSDAPVKAEK